jgi:hypothetical protein
MMNSPEGIQPIPGGGETGFSEARCKDGPEHAVRTVKKINRKDFMLSPPSNTQIYRKGHLKFKHQGEIKFK